MSDLTGEIVERLQKGGEDGITLFMRFAVKSYKAGQQQALMKWTLGAFKYLPKRRSVSLVGYGA